jgi:hypothetical protein
VRDRELAGGTGMHRRDAMTEVLTMLRKDKLDAPLALDARVERCERGIAELRQRLE